MTFGEVGGTVYTVYIILKACCAEIGKMSNKQDINLLTARLSSVMGTLATRGAFCNQEKNFSK